MKFSIVSKLTLIVLLLASVSSNAKPLVLSSLRPLTLIAQEITGTSADVDTLLPATASHHDYPLKASDHARLKQADIILWVGPELESFLQKPLGNIDANKILTAYTLKDLFWPASHDESESHRDSHGHERDPHLWLDPRNAVVVARALTEKLAKIDSANSTYYRENFRLFSEKLKKLDEKLTASLAPIAGIGFVVYHEGFTHFVSHYGLNQLDYLTFTPEQKPGARHLHQLRLVLANEAKCLLLEPYGDTQSARNLAQEFKLRTAVIDALGSQDVSSYSQLLEHMSTAFLTCMTN